MFIQWNISTFTKVCKYFLYHRFTDGLIKKKENHSSEFKVRILTKKSELKNKFHMPPAQIDFSCGPNSLPVQFNWSNYAFWSKVCYVFEFLSTFRHINYYLFKLQIKLILLFGSTTASTALQKFPRATLSKMTKNRHKN